MPCSCRTSFGSSPSVISISFLLFSSATFDFVTMILSYPRCRQLGTLYHLFDSRRIADQLTEQKEMIKIAGSNILVNISTRPKTKEGIKKDVFGYLFLSLHSLSTFPLQPSPSSLLIFLNPLISSSSLLVLSLALVSDFQHILQNNYLNL